MSKGEYKNNWLVDYARSAKLNDSQLDEWEAQIRVYATERGYNLVAVFREEGASGVAPVRRGLNEVIRQVNDPLVVGVIMPSSAHLAESANSAKRIYNRIVAAGCRIHFIGQ